MRPGHDFHKTSGLLYCNTLFQYVWSCAEIWHGNRAVRLVTMGLKPVCAFGSCLPVCGRCMDTEG